MVCFSYLAAASLWQVGRGCLHDRLDRAPVLSCAICRQAGMNGSVRTQRPVAPSLIRRATSRPVGPRTL